MSSEIDKAVMGRWDETKAWNWYNALPWQVGCNFLPSNAVNQLEMWQADTFAPKEIDRELGWLAGIGMNTARVYLHDLLWTQDAAGFLGRMERFLDIAARHKMRILFVIFDSCWHPHPKPGPQPSPKPHTHNSFWAQSPGADIVTKPEEFEKLEGYVTGVVKHFRNDERVLLWDLWNEPDNSNYSSYPLGIDQAEMGCIVTPLLARTFQWARSVNPSQPLTSGVWAGVNGGQIPAMRNLQINASDVISFHNYQALDECRGMVDVLKENNRPLICTEYMARGCGSTFESILPWFKQEKIGAYNWGAVAGKSQTQYPWDSWEKTYTAEPELWHHDIFRPDGTPYDSRETVLIKSLLQA